MNIINIHSSCTMILLGILALTTIIGLTNSAPLSPYERRDDRPKIFLMMNQRIPDFENEMLGVNNDFASDVARTKRIGSLSIVDNLDMLRQAYLSELARRKAEQDQRQVGENRRVFEIIGKRSAPGEYESEDIDRSVRSGTRNGRDRNAASNKNEWLEEDVPLFRASQDDRMARVQANELHLL